jgi:hypothetical protein
MWSTIVALVKVCDSVLWPKHISGDPDLKADLLTLRAGEVAELVVCGVRGHWEKMADGPNGQPTPGLRPLGRMRDRWHALYYGAHRSDLVPIVRPAAT